MMLFEQQPESENETRSAMNSIHTSPFAWGPLHFRVPKLKFQILIRVVGRANAEKTSILQRVCETTESLKM